MVKEQTHEPRIDYLPRDRPSLKHASDKEKALTNVQNPHVQSNAGPFEKTSFGSWAEFSDALAAYEMKQYVLFRKRSSVLSTKHNADQYAHYFELRV